MGVGVAVIVSSGKGVEARLIAGETVNREDDGIISGDTIAGGLVAHAERLSRTNNSKSFCEVFFMEEDYSIAMEILFQKCWSNLIFGSLDFNADFFILCSFQANRIIVLSKRFERKS